MSRGSIPVLTIGSGRLDLAEVGRLRLLIAPLLAEGATGVMVDLASVRFIDSSGLGLLVGLVKSLGRRGQVALCGLHDPALGLLHMTRVDSLFRFFASVEEAQKAMAENGGADDQR